MDLLRAFLTWIYWDIVAVFVASICFSAALAFLIIEPSAVSRPTKDCVCTESAIVNGVAKCVKYERRER